MRVQSRLRFTSAIAPAILLLVGYGCGPAATEAPSSEEAATRETASPDFQISLAQWSLHRTFFGDSIEDWQAFGRTLAESPDDVLQGVDPLEFPAMAAGYGVDSIELVNTFYFSKARDEAYWKEFQKKCDEAGVSVGLIMLDALGNLGDADPEARRATVENHYPWVDVLSSGCECA